MEGANDTWERWMEYYTRSKDDLLYPQCIIGMMVVAATGKPQAATTTWLNERWKLGQICWHAVTQMGDELSHVSVSIVKHVTEEKLSLHVQNGELPVYCGKLWLPLKLTE